jgi:hypothetical protein
MLIILAKTNGPSPPPMLGLFFASLIGQGLSKVSPVLLAAEEKGEQLKHLTAFDSI